MALPMSEFEWVEDDHEKENILKMLPQMDILHCDIGYTLKIDMLIPEHLHDVLDDLPLAPLNEIVNQPTPLMKVVDLIDQQKS